MYRALLILITLSIGCGSFNVEPLEEVPLENNFKPGRWLFTVETEPLFASEDKYVECYLEIDRNEDTLYAETSDCPLIGDHSFKGSVEENNEFFLRTSVEDATRIYRFEGTYSIDGKQAWGIARYSRSSFVDYQVWEYDFQAEYSF